MHHDSPQKRFAAQMRMKEHKLREQFDGKLGGIKFSSDETTKSDKKRMQVLLQQK